LPLKSATLKGEQPVKLKLYSGNPILIPGNLPWRACTTFNPGVTLDRTESMNKSVPVPSA
jgi:hypothetical protein